MKTIVSVRVGSVAKVAAVFSWLVGTMISVFLVLQGWPSKALSISPTSSPSASSRCSIR